MSQKGLSVLLRMLTAMCAVLGVPLCRGIILMGRDLGEEAGKEAFFVPCLVFFLLTAAAVYVTLALAWLVFADIGRDRSFTRVNAKRLQVMSFLFFGDAVGYLLCPLVLAFLHAMHPGIFLAMLAVAFVCVSLTVICAGLSHLVLKGAALKDEVDLTI